MIQVKMVRPWGTYYPGDTPGFNQDVADLLINQGFATFVKDLGNKGPLPPEADGQKEPSGMGLIDMSQGKLPDGVMTSEPVKTETQVKDQDGDPKPDGNTGKPANNPTPMKNTPTTTPPVKPQTAATPTPATKPAPAIGQIVKP